MKQNQEQATGARAYNESTSKQKRALDALRTRSITKMAWEAQFKGARLAPTVDMLRNGHGFTIEGDGSVKSPYMMPDKNQFPSLLRVDGKIKEAYWNSTHWAEMRRRRWEHDSYFCLLCKGEAEQVHHVVYNLFNEELRDLMSVCIDCHERIHAAARLKFPSGIKVDHVRRLGIAPDFLDWTIPKMSEDLFI